jgi:hypothetical protein
MSMATKTSTEGPTWVQARETMCVIVGARAPVYKTAVVRDRHTGQLAEVALAPCEHPPIDEGDEGRSFIFARGEKVLDDHEAVRHAPHCFVPVAPGD